MSYEDFILSMAFYTFDVRDNKKMLSKNKAYRGLAANSSTAKSSYAANWNYSLTDEHLDIDEMSNVQLSTTDIDRMFRPIDPITEGGELLKRRMTVDMATTGFDNLVMIYWELWSKVGWIAKDLDFCVKNTPREAVIRINEFKDKHGLYEKDTMILDVQGFGFLRDCYPKQIYFSGASQPSQRSKGQYSAMKDEAAHLAMEMIVGGLIHFDPKLANARYTHQNMKRIGATTILRHLKFESVIFQFHRTPNGRLVMLEKDKQKTLLKGMSPDITDNIIMLCGGSCYDCYRLLRDDAGMMRKKLEANDMLEFLNVNHSDVVGDGIRERRRIRNASEVLNILSSI